MKILKRSIGLALALSVLASCGRVNDEEMPWQLSSLPVVFSVISPSQTVQVSMCKTLLQNEETDSVFYPLARVYVCGEDKNWIELTRKSYATAVYVDVNREIEVVQGKTYFLRVDLLNDTVTAQTTVPLQNGVITEAEFIIDSQRPENYSYFGGTLHVKLKLPENNQCILIAPGGSIGEGNGTFLYQENITDRFSVPDSINSFDLKLITFDLQLAKYWAAKEEIFQNSFSDGDIDAFMGAYNGILPPYSNIKHGIGLFGSYVINQKTINLNLP